MVKKKILGEIDIQQLISTRDFLHEALHEAESKLETDAWAVSRVRAITHHVSR